MTTADTTGGGFAWSVNWNTTTVTPGPYQLRVIPIFSGGSGQPATGPVVSVDQTRLGVNPWWTFQEVGGGARVNVATGNVIISATDLSVPTPAGDLAFTRTYNSQGAAFSGPLGWGWDFSLPTDDAPAGFTSLTHVTDDGEYVEILDSAGEPLYFLLEDAATNPAWLPEPGAEGMSVAQGTHGVYGAVWEVTDLDGTVYVFDDLGDGIENPLLGSRSANSSGGETGYEYNGSGQLIEASAPGGKSFTLAWSSGRIASIDVDFVGTAGAEIEFTYSNGHLTEVTDVRTGLTWEYSYDVNHRITSITPPGQTAYVLGYTGNKLTSVERAKPGGGTAATTLAYGSWGEGVQTTLTTPRSHNWVYQFDGSSRLRHLSPPSGATQETVWDVHNHAVSTQSAAEAEAGVASVSVYSSEEDPCNLSGATAANDGTDLCRAERPGLGTIRSGPKLGRNALCWCDSGKKYKNCHLASDQSR